MLGFGDGRAPAESSTPGAESTGHPPATNSMQTGHPPSASSTQSGYPAADATQPPYPPPPPAPLPEARVESGSKPNIVAQIITENPGSKFVSFLKISAKRAFRLRIEPTEVLPSEREALERAHPPIVDRNLQAFLAWR